jgi:hypothetical protein
LLLERGKQPVLIRDDCHPVRHDAARSGVDGFAFGPARVGEGQLNQPLALQFDVPGEDAPISGPLGGTDLVAGGGQPGCGQPFEAAAPSVEAGCKNEKIEVGRRSRLAPRP